MLLNPCYVVLASTSSIPIWFECPPLQYRLHYHATATVRIPPPHSRHPLLLPLLHSHSLRLRHRLHSQNLHLSIRRAPARRHPRSPDLPLVPVLAALSLRRYCDSTTRLLQKGR
eukprot:g21822.t1